MFVQHDLNGAEPSAQRPYQPVTRADDPAGLTKLQRDLIWCLRRLALLQPVGCARDAHVHAFLQQRFGEAGLGLEHFLRCLIVGLAQRAVRPIRLHLPCHGPLAPDERRLLLALAEHRYPARLAAVLAPLAGLRGTELSPLLAGIAALLPD